MNIVTIDTEIIKCIPPKTESESEQYQYCDGWTDYTGMGIACICLYRTSDTAKFYWADLAYKPDETQSLSPVQYISNDTSFDLTIASTNHKIWGFNSIGFDDKLLSANRIKYRTEYDLLTEVRHSAFGSTRWQDQPYGHTYKLDAIANANLGRGKIGHGEKAPKQWQDGKYIDVLNYCMDDCVLLARLTELFLSGKLKDPNTGRIILPREDIEVFDTYDKFFIKSAVR